MIDTPIRISMEINILLTIYLNILFTCAISRRFLPQDCTFLHSICFCADCVIFCYLSVTRERFQFSLVNPLNEDNSLSGVNVLSSILFTLYANKSSL